nr:hypothetical protein B0A51_03289 [Rachicladosporium sp. CCFEE 5018]
MATTDGPLTFTATPTVTLDFSPSSTSGPPPFSDSANPSPSSNPGSPDDGTSTGLISHYFIFIALLLCVAGIIFFFMFRRRRKAMLRYNAYQQSQQQAGGRGGIGGGWEMQPPGWRGGWRGGAPGIGEGRGLEAVEGLDERGEAPPAYVAKMDGPANPPGGPTAVSAPPPALTREQSGLRDPPVYQGPSMARQDDGDVGDYWRSGPARGS